MYQARFQARELLTAALPVVLLLIGLLRLSAQPYHLRLLPLDVDSSALAREIDWPAGRYPDSSQLEPALRAVLTQLQAAAYWEASIDTLVRQGRHYTALLHRGPRYTWQELRPAPDWPRAWLSRAGFRARLYQDRPLDYARWLRLQEDLLLEAASAGYPFARIYLDSVRWAGPGQLSARIALERGAAVTIAGLEVPETANISARFLEQYTGLATGAPYDESVVRQLRERLRELPYLQLRGDPSVRFTDDRARVVLPLERRRANQFDFIVGVLPNSQQTGRLLITGELNGEIQNGFGRGERLAVRFEQLRPQTQELALAFNYPFLLNLPFGLDLSADFYRRDTQFLDLGWRAGAAYQWAGGNTLEIFWNRRQTNLLGFDSARVVRLQQLPDTLDVNRSYFGLALDRHQLDYRYNPRRGYAVYLSGSAGQRRIRRNSRLLALGLEALYDSLDERSAQYRVEALLEYYLPLFGQSTVRTALDGGALLGRADILVNEQFRLGGAQRLRGFDQQSVFASRFAILTLEYRFLLGQDAYFYAFGDGAWIDRRSGASPPAQSTTDWPLGFGAGITFDTRAGLFGLSLAFGRQRGAPIDFGAPKVHLGYIGRL